jgi:hypothetical protein
MQKSSKTQFVPPTTSRVKQEISTDETSDKLFQELLKETLSSNVDTIVEANAAADNTNISLNTNIPTNTVIPEATQLQDMDVSEPVQQNAPPLVDFKINDILFAENNGEMPAIDTSDIEAMNISRENKDKLIAEREKNRFYEAYLLRKDAEEKRKYSERLSVPASSWLPKVEQQLEKSGQNPSNAKAGLAQLLAIVSAMAKADEREKVAQVVEATAASLNFLDSKSKQDASKLEKAYQENNKLVKERNEFANELNKLRVEYDVSKQISNSQTSVTSKIATIPQQPKVTITSQIQNLDPVESLFFRSAVLANRTIPNIQRDLSFAKFHSENFKKLPDLGENATFGEIYKMGNKKMKV